MIIWLRTVIIWLRTGKKYPPTGIIWPETRQNHPPRHPPRHPPPGRGPGTLDIFGAQVQFSIGIPTRISRFPYPPPGFGRNFAKTTLLTPPYAVFQGKINKMIVFDRFWWLFDRFSLNLCVFSCIAYSIRYRTPSQAELAVGTRLFESLWLCMYSSYESMSHSYHT